MLHHDNEEAVQSGGICSTIRLTLVPEHCYLGASSDGIITHTQRPSAGVLETKCPVSVSGESVSELSPIEIAQYHPNFYLESKDGAVQLKTTRNYQVQGEWQSKVVHHRIL